MLTDPEFQGARSTSTTLRKAKHSGIYIDIKPDWAGKSKESSVNGTTIYEMNVYDNCNICDLRFFNKSEKMDHFKEFIPIASNEISQHRYQCSKCEKRFCNERAQLQHENFCTMETKT